MHTRTIPAGEFKQKCLSLMEEVASSREELVITKHGNPICKLMPLTARRQHSRFGWMKNSVKIHGDLTQPIEDQWEADR
jgi:prevent-host-death family protein